MKVSRKTFSTSDKFSREWQFRKYCEGSNPHYLHFLIQAVSISERGKKGIFSKKFHREGHEVHEDKNNSSLLRGLRVLRGKKCLPLRCQHYLHFWLGANRPESTRSHSFAGTVWPIASLPRKSALDSHYGLWPIQSIISPNCIMPCGPASSAKAVPAPSRASI